MYYSVRWILRIRKPRIVWNGRHWVCTSDTRKLISGFGSTPSDALSGFWHGNELSKYSVVMEEI
jgi:hypothetical protein